MALKIRLSRGGTNKKPFYRVVVAEESFPRDGRFLERVGHYDPKHSPVRIQLDLERIEHWIGHGAKPSDTVARLMRQFKRGGTAAAEAEAPVPEAAPEPAPAAPAEGGAAEAETPPEA